MTIGTISERGRRALTAATLVAFVVLLPAALSAQGESAAEEATTDFRGKVTLAYGLVFIFVVVFLLISHRRNAALREEIAFLERRLDELEARGGPR